MKEERIIKLNEANSLEEVEDIIKDDPELDAKRVYEEITRHRSNKAEKLDLEELDSVSGGADRDWMKQGCAATCEYDSWCGSNDFCYIFDVTYDRFFETCPDGHKHVYEKKRQSPHFYGAWRFSIESPRTNGRNAAIQRKRCAYGVYDIAVIG